MKQPTLQVSYQQCGEIVSWIEQLTLQKWTRVIDGGKRYRHMTTNLVGCMNYILKGAQSLPSYALINKFMVC